MLGWKEIVQDYVIGHSDRIKKTTRPLLHRFGIEYFTYHRIDANGRYSVLVDQPKWAETYVSEKIYKQDPYLRHPSVYRSGMCLMDHHGSACYRRAFEIGKSRFHWDLGVILIEKKEDAVEFYGFAANRTSSALEQLYINEKSLLKEFSSYFKKNLSPVLKEMEAIGISLPDLKGDDFYSKKPICPITTQQNLAFLADIGFQDEMTQLQSLSRGEKRCLEALVHGFSAKDMAAALHLSPRTIESYLQTLKCKLSCSNKRELFLLAKRFVDLYRY